VSQRQAAHTPLEEGADGVVQSSPKPAGIGFVEQATRHLFSTGKDGVGKTSLSTAAALTLADAGKKVLLVSAPRL
jgi:arsenite-transporting ATPase